MKVIENKKLSKLLGKSIGVEKKIIRFGCYNFVEDAVKAREDYIIKHNLPHHRNIKCLKT